MPISAQTVENLSVGAGDCWYKDGDGVWQPAGATMENNVFRIERDYFAPKLNGVVALLKGTDYLQEERVFLECSLAEVTAAALALSVPDSVSTAETSADVASSPFDSTLAEATTAGQYLAIKVAAVTNLSVGDFIRIGSTPFIEKRRVTRVGTALAGGTGIDIDFPLIAAHALGEDAVEIDGLGGTVITGGTERRMPSTAYHDWRLDVPGLDGRMTRFLVFGAIATEDAEFEAADDDAMHPRLVLAGRRDAATPQTSAWQIRKEAAFA